MSPHGASPMVRGSASPEAASTDSTATPVRNVRTGRPACYDRMVVDVPGAPGADLETWAKGLVSNLLNPKYGMFCIAVIPQFLVPGVPPVAMGLLLSVVANAEALVWFLAIIAAAQFFGRWLNGATFRKWIDRVTGTVLGAFGVVAGLELRRAWARG